MNTEPHRTLRLYLTALAFALGLTAYLLFVRAVVEATS
jgi:hypothetical protein